MNKSLDTCRVCGTRLHGASTCPVCGTPIQKKNEKRIPMIPYKKAFPHVGKSKGKVCEVCGFELDEADLFCEMCGAPVLEHSEDKEEYRCPICHHPISMTSSRCEHCNTSFVDEEKEKDMNFRCPVCGKIVQIRDEVCPSCGSRIWLDTEVAVERLSEYRCPFCDSRVKAESSKCQACGRSIWPGEEDLKELAEKKLREAGRRIRSEEDNGDIDLTLAKRILSDGRKAFEMSDFVRATRSASLCLDITESRLLQLKILSDATQRAKNIIKKAYESGGNVGQSLRLLKRSTQLRKSGNERGALRLAVMARIKAEGVSAPQRILSREAEGLG